MSLGATWVDPDTGKFYRHDGAGFVAVPTTENPVVLFQANGINAVSVGNIQLPLYGALADGTILLPFAVVFQTTAFSSVVAGPSVSIGTNGPNFTNVMPATVLTFGAATQTLSPILASPGRALAPNSQVFARVSVGATGIGAACSLRAVVVCARIP